MRGGEKEKERKKTKKKSKIICRFFEVKQKKGFGTVFEYRIPRGVPLLLVVCSLCRFFVEAKENR